MKKKAAYIDHSFKKKTKSNEFLKEIFSVEYDLTELWDDSWKGGRTLSLEYLNNNNFEVIFFFQYLPSFNFIRSLKCKKIVWFPMYDQEVNRNKSFYLRYLNSNLKIISFSKSLFLIFKKLGFNVYYYQYFKKPKYNKIQTNNLKVFFWFRKNPINWDVVKKLVGNNKIDSMIIKNNPDPNQKFTFPTNKEIKRYKIRIIDKWLSKNDYNNLLDSCNVFIAPREYEGIGMSFIEALSKSMCIIACDNPTMNEYITHEINGFFYNLNEIEAVNLKYLFQIRKNVKEYTLRGYNLWKKNKLNILHDINRPNDKTHFIKILYLKFVLCPFYGGQIFNGFLNTIKRFKKLL